MSHKIYRIPGMGADKRLYAEIEPIDGYEFVDLEWRLNYKNIKTLKDYALELSKEIDTSQPFSLLGVSMPFIFYLIFMSLSTNEYSGGWLFTLPELLFNGKELITFFKNSKKSKRQLKKSIKLLKLLSQKLKI